MIDKYLVTGIAIIFVIFTLIKTKLPHYTLPAFPLLALLLARHWQGAAIGETARLLAVKQSQSLPPVCGLQSRSLFLRWWRGFFRRISSFKNHAHLCNRTCNLPRWNSRSRVWSGIFDRA